MCHNVSVGRFKRSWELGKLSWSVLRSDHTLSLFPVYSALVTTAVFAVFAVLVALVGFTGSGETASISAVGIVIVIVGYIVAAFVMTYFQAALVLGANDVLEGRNATVKNSLHLANSNLGKLLPWAVVQGTVSFIIAAIEEKASFVGRIVVGLIGAAWSVVTFLTIPIIVFEKLGPWSALKRSGTLLKSTWGENIIAQGGLGVLGLVASLPGIILIVLGVLSNTLVIAIPLCIIGGLILIVASVVVSAMTGIYRTALYRYAVDGRTPTAFASIDMAAAFGPRKSRSR